MPLTRFLFPFPRRVAPDEEITTAQLASIRWLQDNGLLADAETTSWYDRWEVARLAGLMYPEARGSELLLATKILGTVFLLDDQFDGELATRPDAVVPVIGPLINLVHAPLASAHTQVPLYRAAAELWGEAADPMSLSWRSRTAGCWEQFIVAYAHEAHCRKVGTPPPWNVFRILRRFSGVTGFLLNLAERVEKYEIPELVHWSPQIQWLQMIAVEVPVFTNDPNSLDKEGEDEVNNLVVALRHYNDCDQNTAIAELARIVNHHLREFSDTAHTLSTVWSDLGLTETQQEAAARYIHSMGHIMRGYHEWEVSTARYAEPRRHRSPAVHAHPLLSPPEVR